MNTLDHYTKVVYNGGMATHPAHQANIDRKTGRALNAIESLAATFATDPRFPEVTDTDTGLAFFLDNLTGDPIDTAPYWVMIGIETDRQAGVTTYTNRIRPTNFETSRQTIIDNLTALVELGPVTAPTDPFQGLAF